MSSAEVGFGALDRLLRTHGDPLYLVDPARFRDNLRSFQTTFEAVHPRVSPAYSYKTNYTPLLCRIADDEGWSAEVVSGMELELALRLGVPGSRIIFNGPLKSAADLDLALCAGALVNVDSLAEVEAVEAFARTHPGVSSRLGVRSSLVLGPGHASRFGLASHELREAVDRLRALPGRPRIGLHGHVSGFRDAQAFRARAMLLVEQAAELFPDAPPAFIDIGGGMFGHLTPAMEQQFGGQVPSWAVLAAAVGPVLAAAWSGTDTPELVLEPGTAVVADTVELVCRVAALKQLDGRAVAVVTGSLQNIKATQNPIRLPITVVRDPNARGRRPGPVDVVGYTCMESDVLQVGVPEDLAIGDLLVFGHVGAYAGVFKPPFIRPDPAILAQDAGGGWIVVRRAETLDDLLAAYLLPREHPTS